MRKTAVSFTGGKDSTLTIHLLTLPPKLADAELRSRLENFADCSVHLLVTFVMAGSEPCKAHAPDVVKLQAEAMGIAHITLEFEAPYLESYRKNIRRLHDEHGITALATGDMMDIGHGFMPRAVEGTGVELLTPLWGMERQKVLDLVWSYGMLPIITCVNTKLLGISTADTEPCQEAADATSHACDPVQPLIIAECDADPESAAAITVENLLGRALTPALHRGVLLPAARLRGADECGERGEYHTMVCDGARFARRVELETEARRRLRLPPRPVRPPRPQILTRPGSAVRPAAA